MTPIEIRRIAETGTILYTPGGILFMKINDSLKRLVGLGKKAFIGQHTSQPKAGFNVMRGLGFFVRQDLVNFNCLAGILQPVFGRQTGKHQGILPLHRSRSLFVKLLIS